MAIETYSEQLERVQAAIRKVEGGGQTVEWEGRRITRGDLEILYRREATLRRQVEREQGGGGMRVAYGVPS